MDTTSVSGDDLETAPCEERIANFWLCSGGILEVFVIPKRAHTHVSGVEHVFETQ